MDKPTFTILSRTYLIMLGILSFWFMAMMAVAEPLCINCSINLVKWALPRAEILSFAWIVAGIGTLWHFRQSVAAFLLRSLRIPRKAVATTQNQIDD